MYKPSGQIKTKQLKVRLTEREYEFIRAKASAADMTVTDFVLAAVNSKQVKGFSLKDFERQFGRAEEQIPGQMAIDV